MSGSGHGSNQTFTGAVYVAIVAALFAASAPARAQERVPVRTREIELRGVIRPQHRQVRAQLRAYVATPFGRIPVTGHADLRYTCAGTFSGSVDYNTVIRVLAQLKGIDLVRVLEGTVRFEQEPPCGTGPDIFLTGRAVTDSLNVRGWYLIARDSTAFRGVTWFDGESHHGTVATMSSGNRLEVRYLMRGPARPGRSSTLAAAP